MPEMTQQDLDQLFLMFVEIVDFDRLKALLPQHLAWLTGKFKDGSLVVTGRLMEEDGSEGNHALVIVRAPSIEETRRRRSALRGRRLPVHLPAFRSAHAHRSFWSHRTRDRVNLGRAARQSLAVIDN
jgi:uncharacterized protein YciI